MFEALIAWLVAAFLLAPLQDAVAERLEAGRAPAVVVEGVVRCAAEAGPLLAARAGADPWWAVSTALGVWVGVAAPEAVLRDAAPGCAPALQAARPYIAGS